METQTRPASSTQVVGNRGKVLLLSYIYFIQEK